MKKINIDIDPFDFFLVFCGVAIVVMYVSILIFLI